MKFRIKCKNITDKTGEHAWWETYEETTTDPEQWGKNIVAYYNRTLRKHETKRVFLKAVIYGDALNEEQHDWDKQLGKMSVMTNQGVTGRLYDGMYCTKCGITGKRFGLGSSHIAIDSKFRKKAFRKCNTAKQELNQ
jgi:hypothetical protein